MKELKLFVCEHCGTQYKEKEKAKECEKKHTIPMEIKDSRYHSMSQYPDKVEVKFTDGSTCWYKR